jgi:hypothetical protein
MVACHYLKIGGNRMITFYIWLIYLNPGLSVAIRKNRPLSIWISWSPEDVKLPKGWYYYNGMFSNIGDPKADIMWAIEVAKKPKKDKC